MKSHPNIPNKEECLKIFNRYVIFSNVEEHCIAATTLAMYLAEKTKTAGLNLDLIFAATLLHDLGKAATIEKLEPEKFGFKSLTEEQTKTWKTLRQLYHSMETVFKDLNSLYPDQDKKVHETDITAIIVGSLFPDFVQYIHQIGGTGKPMYFGAGPEIKISHYADWRMHGYNLAPFEMRLDYVLDTYGKTLSTEEKSERKRKEFELEKEIFEGLNITPDVDIDELNEKKRELFGSKYDYFRIEKLDKIKK